MYDFKVLYEVGARSVNLGVEYPVPFIFGELLITSNLYRFQVFQKALDDDLVWIGFEHERFRFDMGLKIHFHFF